jgi:hypothetical protein
MAQSTQDAPHKQGTTTNFSRECLALVTRPPQLKSPTWKLSSHPSTESGGVSVTKLTYLPPVLPAERASLPIVQGPSVTSFVVANSTETGSDP